MSSTEPNPLQLHNSLHIEEKTVRANNKSIMLSTRECANLIEPRNSGSIHCAAGSIIRDPEPNSY